MKELYISPEAEVVCFAPVERLAAIVYSNDTYGEKTDSMIDVPDESQDQP